MHVEARKKGRHRRYYLAHSFRRGKRVLKMRVYLGTDITAAEIAARKKRAEKLLGGRMAARNRIGDPFETVLSPSEALELKMLEPRGNLRVLHLSEEEWRRFTEAFTYDTNAIEGSTVSFREVGDVLEKDKRPADKPASEVSETYGVAKAVALIRKTKTRVSLQLILELHRLVFENSKPFAGRLRRRGEEVVVADARGNVVHRGAPSAHVRHLLEELARWYGKNKGKYPPLVLAAVVHNQFENIHPFRDGNGRVGRLLLNNVLLKHGLPPLNIELKHRREYYAALQAYENSHDLRPTLELMLKEYRALRCLLQKR